MNNFHNVTHPAAFARRSAPTYQVCGDLILFVLLPLLALLPPLASAESRVPTEDSEVLVRLDASLPRASAVELHRLRRSPADTLHPLETVLPLSRDLILLARAAADPRPLRHAQALLAPWLAVTDPPLEALVLHATIRQSLHDFDGALTELDLVLRRDPKHGQAWLTRAVILTVRGDYEQARAATFQALRFADPLAATAAIAALGGANGSAERAYDLLLRALTVSGDEPPAPGTEPSAVRAWAWLTLGELAERRALPGLALIHYETALAFAPADLFALGALADLLLEQNRADEVILLLAPQTRHDPLLLRLAEAHRQVAVTSSGPNDHEGRAQHYTAVLRKRFAQGRLREGDLHLREEARFALRLLDRPDRALELAQKNWQTQREWADARLLIEAAEAAGEPRLAAKVRSTLHSSNPAAATAAQLP